MLALSLFTAAFAAVSAVALPTVSRVSQSCNNLGGGAFDTVSNFTLAALNTTLPNANTTGAPLVVGQAGATSGLSFKVLSTFASYPFDQYPSYSLEAGRLIPQGPHTTPARASLVAAGDEVGFTASNSVDPKSSAQIYCAVADTDPAGHGTGHPLLAVNGNTDAFSLCKDGTQNNLVFMPTSGKIYDIDSCYAVKVQLIYDD